MLKGFVMHYKLLLCPDGTSRFKPPSWNWNVWGPNAHRLQLTLRTCPHHLLRVEDVRAKVEMLTAESLQLSCSTTVFFAIIWWVLSNFNLSAEQRGNEPGFNTTPVQPQRHCSAHHKHLNTTVWLQHNCNVAQQLYGKADAKSQWWSAILGYFSPPGCTVRGRGQRVKIH